MPSPRLTSMPATWPLVTVAGSIGSGCRGPCRERTSPASQRAVAGSARASSLLHGGPVPAAHGSPRSASALRAAFLGPRVFACLASALSCQLCPATGWAPRALGPASWLRAADRGPCSLRLHLGRPAQLACTAADIEGAVFLRAPAPRTRCVLGHQSTCRGECGGASRCVGPGELLQAHHSERRGALPRGCVLQFYKCCQVAHEEVSLILLHQPSRGACLPHSHVTDLKGSPTWQVENGVIFVALNARSQ